MPSKNEVRQFKMFSDQALQEFKIFCARGRLPVPDGAHDSKPKYARDQKEPPVDALVGLIEKLVADNARLKRMVTDRKIARDDYEAPQDDVSKGLIDLLELLKQTMKPADYTKAEIAVSRLMEQSKQRIAEHHSELNEANATVSGDALPENLRRIRIDPAYGVQPPPRRTPPQTTADAERFNAAFPGAARIGHV